MALVTCPKCRAHLDLDDEHLGHEVDCGACGAVFVAQVEGGSPRREREDEDYERPSRRSRDDDDDDDDDFDRPRRRRRRSPDLDLARTMIRPPAICLIVTASIGLAWRLLDFVFTLVFGGMMLQQGGPGGPGGPGGAGGPNNQAFAAGQLAGGVVVDVISIALSIMVIVASIRMMKLQGYGLAMTACILSLTPCAGCCLMGLPFGIWGIVMLNNSTVREAFNWQLGRTSDEE